MSNAESPIARDLDATPLAYPVNTFAKAIGVGRSKVYEEIRNGRLRAKKLGGRTLITGKDARDYLDCLPDARAQQAA
jgi:excisionase family DNA binding protein